MNSTTFTRRSFLAAGGCFTLAGCAGFPAITSTRSPNGRVRHAAIGCGNMAWSDINDFCTHPNIEMAAFCDVDANYLAQAKAKFPQARFYRDWRELLASEGDRIDSMNVSIPDHNHTLVAAKALRSGKHVYLQKPLCKTMREARLLRELGASCGRVTQMGAQFIASEADRQTVKLLREGTLGPVEHVTFFTTRKGLSRNRRPAPVPVAPPKTLEWDLWLGTAAARPYAEGVYHPLLWRIWRDLGSGWLGDIGCHLMSSVWMGLGLNDLSPVDVVTETETDSDPSVKDLVWPTATHIRWTMPAVAATGGKSIFFDWYDGCSEPDQLAPAWSRPPAEIEALFAKTPYGRRGHEGKAIRCRDGWILALHRSEKGIFVVRNDGTVASGPEVGPAPTHFHEFIDRCRDGRKAAADFAWSTHMMELILTGTIAERLPGRKLAWNRAAQSFGDAAADAFLGSEYRSGWSL